jgi:hypothetical protein
MKLQQRVPLATIYKREEDFSIDLAHHLPALGVGAFEDCETESPVGTRRADIVAKGDSGVLVVENQFGKADWDHWGRLEAYARLKEANVAALIAEAFEELMVVTCNLRNEDSETDWYLIQAEANSHHELSFHAVAFPAIDIQTERKNVEYSEFWAPIREQGLFAGKPVPVRDEQWIGKSVRGVGINLRLNKNSCSVLLYFSGDDRIERRESVEKLFADGGLQYELHESPKFANIIFPVLDKGKNDRDDWPAIRTALTSKGEQIYNVIADSDI